MKISKNKKIPLLGSVARFHPQKDHKNLFQALNLLKINKIFFKCVLVGHKINAKNKLLIKMIKKFNLSKEVILLGPKRNINQIMNVIDIHILASEYGEAFPNVVAEAMACGTPCVVTDVGDSSLIVGKTGWIVRPSDSKGLAYSIKKQLKNLNQRVGSYFVILQEKELLINFH